MVACLMTNMQFDRHMFRRVYEQLGRGSIVVRAHASRAEGLRFESDSMP